MLIFNKRNIKERFIDPPVLETKRLILRKISLSDTGDMFEYSKNPETSRYLLWEPHKDIAFTENHIRRIENMYMRKEYFTWGVEYRENGKFIGTCGFTSINERKNIAEVGYVLSPDYHRMKIAPEALLAIMKYGFEEIGFERLFARFMEDNTASRKVLERFSFFDDTDKEEYILKRGKNEKILYYSIDRKSYFNNKGFYENFIR